MIKPWLKLRIKLLAILTCSLIIIQLINSLSGYSLVTFGLVPRTFSGLLGIIFAPFIHGSWDHLFSNLLPLLILSALLLREKVTEYITASLFIILSSGFIVWLIGRDAIHIGASGWIFGLWGLLIAQGYFCRRLSDLIVAGIVLFYFGAMATGLLPIHQYISTESHIAGTLSGIFYAWWTHHRRKKRLSTS